MKLLGMRSQWIRSALFVISLGMGSQAIAATCNVCSGHIDLGLGASTPGVTLTVGYGSPQGSGSNPVRPNGKCHLDGLGLCVPLAPCEFYLRFTQIVIPGMDVPLSSALWNPVTQQWDIVIVTPHFTSANNNTHDEAGSTIDCGGPAQQWTIYLGNSSQQYTEVCDECPAS